MLLPITFELVRTLVHWENSEVTRLFSCPCSSLLFTTRTIVHSSQPISTQKTKFYRTSSHLGFGEAHRFVNSADERLLLCSYNQEHKSHTTVMNETFRDEGIPSQSSLLPVLGRLEVFFFPCHHFLIVCDTLFTCLLTCFPVSLIPCRILCFISFLGGSLFFKTLP